MGVVDLPPLLLCGKAKPQQTVEAATTEVASKHWAGSHKDGHQV